MQGEPYFQLQVVRWRGIHESFEKNVRIRYFSFVLDFGLNAWSETELDILESEKTFLWRMR